eukprot:15068114-Alexandrium_andersonii.AAC.1
MRAPERAAQDLVLSMRGQDHERRESSRSRSPSSRSAQPKVLNFTATESRVMLSSTGLLA